MNELPPSPEFSEAEERLIRLLRERGLEDPEALDAFITWCQQLEAIAKLENTARAGIEVELKKAKACLAAGLDDQAWDTLEAICDQADSLADVDDLHLEALRLMKQIAGDE
jgi:hypothetical protein